MQGLQSKNIKGILPRMWSGQHAENYMSYFGPLDFKMKQSNEELRQAVNQVKTGYANGEIDAEQYISFLKRFDEYLEVQPPRFGRISSTCSSFSSVICIGVILCGILSERHNDVQGRYDENGKWLTGIQSVDSAFHGSQENLPSDIKDNKAQKHLFLFALDFRYYWTCSRYQKTQNSFGCCSFSFCSPVSQSSFIRIRYIFQPRERDYSLVGSFYVFALWIGLGVYGLFDEFKKWVSPKILAPAVTLVCLLAVPTVMAVQNWDDHDRSNRFTARFLGKILFRFLPRRCRGHICSPLGTTILFRFGMPKKLKIIGPMYVSFVPVFSRPTGMLIK